MEPSCVKYGTCVDCAGTNRVGVPGSTPLLANNVCLLCYRENKKQVEEVLIETSNKRELQEIDYICKFYENRRD